MTAITLPADLEAWARAEVAAGRAESIEAVVAKALEASRSKQAYVRNALDKARASVAAGRTVSLSEALKEIDAWIAEDEAAAKAALKAAE
jgi:predicted transcriptional regulator